MKNNNSPIKVLLIVAVVSITVYSLYSFIDYNDSANYQGKIDFSNAPRNISKGVSTNTNIFATVKLKNNPISRSERAVAANSVNYNFNVSSYSVSHVVPSYINIGETHKSNSKMTLASNSSSPVIYSNRGNAGGIVANHSTNFSNNRVAFVDNRKTTLLAHDSKVVNAPESGVIIMNAPLLPDDPTEEEKLPLTDGWIFLSLLSVVYLLRKMIINR